MAVPHDIPSPLPPYVTFPPDDEPLQNPETFQPEPLPKITTPSVKIEVTENAEYMAQSAPQGSFAARVAKGICRAMTGFKKREIAEGIKKVWENNKTLPKPLAALNIIWRGAAFTLGSILVVTARAAGIAAALSIAIAAGAIILTYNTLKLAAKIPKILLKIPVGVIKVLLRVPGFIMSPIETTKRGLKSMKESARKKFQSVKDFSAREALKKINPSDALENIVGCSIIGGVAISGSIAWLGMNIVKISVDIDINKEELNARVLEDSTNLGIGAAVAGTAITSMGALLYLPNQNSDRTMTPQEVLNLYKP